MKVTVVGAGFYGSTTVQRIAEANYVDEVAMVDIIEGKPQGLALDINESSSLESFDTRIIGSNDYSVTANSDVCVITAGLPRKPGMSRMDLLEVNAKIVSDVTRNLMEHSPDTILIVVSNPLDEMTTLAAAVSELPKQKVMGQAGMLDSSRLRYFLAEKFGVSTSKVEALTLGSHGDTMVPVPSLMKIDGRPLLEMTDEATIDEIVQRTRDGGAEVVNLLKTGSAYFAPSSAAAKMVEAVVKDAKAAMPVCAWLTGQYGISETFLGVPAKLGKGGVEEIVELSLSDAEKKALQEAAEAVSAKSADALEFVYRRRSSTCQISSFGPKKPQ